MKDKEYVYVGYDESRGWNVEPDPDDEWDSGDAYVVFSVEDVRAKDTLGSCREMIEVSFSPAPEQKVYVIVTRYDTGDTFGRVENTWQITGVVDSREAADSICKQIDKDSRNSNEFSLQLEDHADALPEPSIHCSWKGYFEDYRGVEAFPMVIDGGTIRYGR
jgi:hypothetical protein